MSLELFKTRYSCRNFKKETIEDEILKEILEVARLSPSSLGLEPWKFLVIKDAKKRRIKPHSKSSKPCKKRCGYCYYRF